MIEKTMEETTKNPEEERMQERKYVARERRP